MDVWEIWFLFGLPFLLRSSLFKSLRVRPINCFIYRSLIISGVLCLRYFLLAKLIFSSSTFEICLFVENNLVDSFFNWKYVLVILKPSDCSLLLSYMVLTLRDVLLNRFKFLFWIELNLRTYNCVYRWKTSIFIFVLLSLFPSFCFYDLSIIFPWKRILSAHYANYD